MIDAHAHPDDAHYTHDTVGEDRERGDVPGWVLVTLMTAGLVLALWAVAGPALLDVFQSAMDRVTAFSG